MRAESMRDIRSRAGKHRKAVEKDARIMAPGGDAYFDPANPLWWRGRLAEVDGWHLGNPFSLA